eukprot:gene34356-42373_t
MQETNEPGSDEDSSETNIMNITWFEQLNKAVIMDSAESGISQWSDVVQQCFMSTNLFQRQTSLFAGLTQQKHWNRRDKLHSRILKATNKIDESANGPFSDYYSLFSNYAPVKKINHTLHETSDTTAKVPPEYLYFVTHPDGQTHTCNALTKLRLHIGQYRFSPLPLTVDLVSLTDPRYIRYTQHPEHFPWISSERAAVESQLSQNPEILEGNISSGGDEEVLLCRGNMSSAHLPSFEHRQKRPESKLVAEEVGRILREANLEVNGDGDGGRGGDVVTARIMKRRPGRPPKHATTKSNVVTSDSSSSSSSAQYNNSTSSNKSANNTSDSGDLEKRNIDALTHLSVSSPQPLRMVDRSLRGNPAHDTAVRRQVGVRDDVEMFRRMSDLFGCHPSPRRVRVTTLNTGGNDKHIVSHIVDEMDVDNNTDSNSKYKTTTKLVHLLDESPVLAAHEAEVPRVDFLQLIKNMTAEKLRKNMLAVSAENDKQFVDPRLGHTNKRIREDIVQAQASVVEPQIASNKRVVDRSALLGRFSESALVAIGVVAEELLRDQMLQWHVNGAPLLLTERNLRMEVFAQLNGVDPRSVSLDLLVNRLEALFGSKLVSKKENIALFRREAIKRFVAAQTQQCVDRISTFDSASSERDKEWRLQVGARREFDHLPDYVRQARRYHRDIKSKHGNSVTRRRSGVGSCPPTAVKRKSHVSTTSNGRDSNNGDEYDSDENQSPVADKRRKLNHTSSCKYQSSPALTQLTTSHGTAVKRSSARLTTSPQKFTSYRISDSETGGERDKEEGSVYGESDANREFEEEEEE